MKTDKTLDDLFKIVDEHQIYKFAKSYAYANEEFAKQLKTQFRKQLPTVDNTPSKTELMKALEHCFAHEAGGSSWWRYDDWEPDFQDWNAVSRDLQRFIRQLQMLVESGHESLALDVSLALLERAGKEYDAEWDYGNEDLDDTDLHTDETLDILRTALASGKIPDKHQLEICEKLERLARMEAYDSGDFRNIVENIREKLLTDDERIAIRRREFDEADRDYARESAAVELWDYLMRLGRENEAVRFYKEYSELHQLRTRYAEWLIAQGKLEAAVLVLSDGIVLARELPGVQMEWERRLLEIFEQMNDRPRIIKQIRRLFLKDRDTMHYYHKMKALFAPDEWPSELRELLGKKNFGQSATSPLAEIYEEEKWFDDLFLLLNSAQSDLLSALSRYAKHFDESRQQTLVARLEPVLRAMAKNLMGREHYKELTQQLKTLAKSCPPGKALAVKLVSDFRMKYKNRPAMLDELSKFN